MAIAPCLIRKKSQSNPENQMPSDSSPAFHNLTVPPRPRVALDPPGPQPAWRYRASESTTTRERQT